MSFKGKKLLVIGGASQHCKVVEAAKKLGIITYVIDYLMDSPAKRIADKSYLLDIKDIDSILELCKQEKIDGAIATSLDSCQIPYQKICEKMGYPCFGNKEQFRILTNKHDFKECCKKYGVDTIPSYTYENLFEEDSIEYPIFIKPVDSRGSRGQSICRNREEALQAIEKAKRESSDGRIIIEKYMDNCKDFTVAYLFIDGKAHIVRTGDRFGGSKGSGLENLCIASCSPSKYSSLLLNGINDKIVNMLKGIGIVNGPVFFQGFVDGNKIRLYDPGLRFAGGEYERILKYTSSVDIIELLVKFSVSGEMEEIELEEAIYNLSGRRLIQLDPTLKPGKIKEIKGMDIISENSNIRSISCRCNVGDEIRKTNDLGQRFGEFCILSESLDEEIKAIHYVQDNLKILDEEGNDMIFEKFDTNNLL